jgi:hypothetical protein
MGLKEFYNPLDHHETLLDRVGYCRHLSLMQWAGVMDYPEEVPDDDDDGGDDAGRVLVAVRVSVWADSKNRSCSSYLMHQNYFVIRSVKEIGIGMMWNY